MLVTEGTQAPFLQGALCPTVPLLDSIAVVSNAVMPR